VYTQVYTESCTRSSHDWRFHRHDPVAEQYVVLCQKLQGHYGYYGLTGNSPALSRFQYEVLRL
jgi:hypothetical protein